MWTDWKRADFIAALDANMLTPLALMKALLPGMMSRGWGRVVNITSQSVKAPIPVLGLSNAARAGLTGYVAGTARQVAPHGVTINNLLPGIHATDRADALDRDVAAAEAITLDEARARRAATIPARRYGTPAEFGAACAFVCSQHAGFIVGQNILLDGGTVNATLQRRGLRATGFLKRRFWRRPCSHDQRHGSADRHAANRAVRDGCRAQNRDRGRVTRLGDGGADRLHPPCRGTGQQHDDGRADSRGGGDGVGGRSGGGSTTCRAGCADLGSSAGGDAVHCHRDGLPAVNRPAMLRTGAALDLAGSGVEVVLGPILAPLLARLFPRVQRLPNRGTRATPGVRYSELEPGKRWSRVVSDQVDAYLACRR